MHPTQNGRSTRGAPSGAHAQVADTSTHRHASPHFLVALLLLLPTLALGEEFVYELYRLESGTRVAISQGTVVHSPGDPRLSASKQVNTGAVHRELRFAPGFAVGVTDYGEKSPDGFGCWLRRNTSALSVDRYEGFSWEWYDRAIGSLYTKRKGNGTVSVRVEPSGAKFALSRIEFREDTVFQMNVDPSAKPGTYTHELVIRAGSALAFPIGVPQ